jgi:hypothetical protein
MAFSAGRRKQRTPISDSLQRKLSLYALAAGAAGASVLATSSPAEGEVVYTPAHQLLGRNQEYAIDFNHDGITDFTLENFFLRDGRHNSYVAAALELVSSSGATVCSHEGYAAAALPKGAKIGSQAPFAKGCNVLASRLGGGSFGTYSFGDWFDNQDQYLGLRFEIDGEIHYGWARLTVGWEHKYHVNALLTGYAYETEPNTQIIAGDQGNGAAEVQSKLSSSVTNIQKTLANGLGNLSLGTVGLPANQRESR